MEQDDHEYLPGVNRPAYSHDVLMDGIKKLEQIENARDRNDKLYFAEDAPVPIPYHLCKHLQFDEFYLFTGLDLYDDNGSQIPNLAEEIERVARENNWSLTQRRKFADFLYLAATRAILNRFSLIIHTQIESQLKFLPDLPQ